MLLRQFLWIAAVFLVTTIFLFVHLSNFEDKHLDIIGVNKSPRATVRPDPRYSLFLPFLSFRFLSTCLNVEVLKTFINEYYSFSFYEGTPKKNQSKRKKKRTKTRILSSNSIAKAIPQGIFISLL